MGASLGRVIQQQSLVRFLITQKRLGKKFPCSRADHKGKALNLLPSRLLKIQVVQK
jgi:hypothetical protein